VDKNKAKIVFTEIKAAVEAILARHNCTLTPTGYRFSNELVRFKVEAVEKTAAVQREAAVTASMPVKTGETFNYGGRTYEVSGTRPGRHNAGHW
jgi:hypothetical protein